MISLAGKAALVTGGSRGIGAATVRLFAQAGADVVFNYHRNSESAAQIEQETRKHGTRIESLKADLGKMADAKKLVCMPGHNYIYESSNGREPVRLHATGEPRTLDEYRARYAQYKTDADLQLAHAVAPWIVTWDDHEVDNDYAGDRSEDLDPNFVTRRAAAYRAFFEHHPLRASVLLDGMGIRIFDRPIE